MTMPTPKDMITLLKIELRPKVYAGGKLREFLKSGNNRVESSGLGGAILFYIKI